jgi:hypothetical protein
MPKPLSWKDDEWTKGIKFDRNSYELFLYGTQALRKITVPIHNAILKEMFSQVMSAEAKKAMKRKSIDPIYGAPIILPLVDRPYELLFRMLLNLMKDNKDQPHNEQHIEVVKQWDASVQNDENDVSDEIDMELFSGLDKRVNIPPSIQDEFRMTILYYSGDLSRGNMHIRAVVEDVVPSVVRQIAEIIEHLKRIEYADIQRFVGLNPDKQNDFEKNRISSLPALIGNAYGPGYLWALLYKILHRQAFSLDRVVRATAIRLNELANKRDTWGMRHELVFYLSFLSFYNAYQEQVLKQTKGVNGMSEWRTLAERYNNGDIEEKTLHDPETLGFVSGLLLKQFSNSYHQTTKKDFIEHRVMRFGSKLTPEMIWKDGVLRCIELDKQWKLKLGKNFYEVLPVLLQGFSHANEHQKLVSDQHVFINGFWSGYLTYKNPNSDKKSDMKEGEPVHVNP